MSTLAKILNDKVILSWGSSLKLAGKLSKLLNIKTVTPQIDQFPNSETRVWIEENLKGKGVYIVKSLSSPTNEKLIEMLLVTDAIKRYSPGFVKAIIPWLCYTPQDKIFRKGEAMSVEVVINLLESTIIDEFFVFDIHSLDTLKLFSKKVTNLTAMPVFVEYFKNKVDKKNWCSVALDKGSRMRALLFANELGLPLVQFDKTRDKDTGEVAFHKLEGNVKGKNVISFDDFVSSGGTRIKASKILKDEGAIEYVDCVTHVIVENTLEKIQDSDIDKFFTTNSIYLPFAGKYPKVEVLDISKLINEVIG